MATKWLRSECSHFFDPFCDQSPPAHQYEIGILLYSQIEHLYHQTQYY